jgi:hypothetical protein
VFWSAFSCGQCPPQDGSAISALGGMNIFIVAPETVRLPSDKADDWLPFISVVSSSVKATGTGQPTLRPDSQWPKQEAVDGFAKMAKI